MKIRTITLIAALSAIAGPALGAGHQGDPKLDGVLRQHAHTPQGTSRVIIQTHDGSPLDGVIRAVGGTPGRTLHLLHAQVARVPDTALDELAENPAVTAVRLDRRVRGTMERTAATIGARWVQQDLGFDGAGVGIAIVDSGVTPWHDDLGTDRIVHFADFVASRSDAYDDYGHGTHVAGIIAGSGYDSNGARRGIAPGANLVVLKVLDGTGNGYISNVIAALDYAVENRATYNIRVLNLSVAAGVYESYKTDPLTLAAKRAVDAGIVVVTAAGNLGADAHDRAQYGGITSPGNAPWVLTVGASSHMGTVDRSDDTVARFSSRGPTYIDYAAKPDLVAPGVGTESLTDASTLLYRTHPTARLWGTVATASEPYLSLSGTSMAAPVVSATVALMIQANPALTPNAVKAILQYTAEEKAGYNPLTEGAGFLNARGAVDLALRFAGAQGRVSRNSPTGPSVEDPTPWSQHIIWGNHRVGGGRITPRSNAWSTTVTWGDATTPAGENIVWGTVDDGCDANVDPTCQNIVWGTSAACDSSVDPSCQNIVWGTSDSENIVWGTDCGGADCETVVWGTSADCGSSEEPSCENIVWGTAAPGDAVIWGTSCDTETGCENIVWGTSDDENIVWGTAAAAENTVWGPELPQAEVVSATDTTR